MNQQRDKEITFARLRRKVERKLSKVVVDDVLSFIEQRHPILWGIQQPYDFIQAITLLTLYHDLEMIGYVRLVSMINLDFEISDKSLRHNACKIRLLLFEWGESKVIEGDQDTWTATSINVSHPKSLKPPILWVDSTDVPLEHKRGMGTKSPDWSFKLNKPGQRFMVLSDGLGFVRKVWGGYSPKVHDSQFMALLVDWCEEHLEHVTLVGDQHFEPLKHRWPTITFYTPYKTPPESKDSFTLSGISMLIKAQEVHNARVRRLRSRVERPFAWIKSTFASLRIPFAEAKEQQECLVWFAIGCFNVFHSQFQYWGR